MPKTLIVDWKAVQADRDAGTPVVQVAKKYGVSYATVFNHTHGGARRKGPVGAKAKKAARLKLTVAASAERAPTGAEMLAGLESLRGRIDAAMGALKNLLDAGEKTA